MLAVVRKELADRWVPEIVAGFTVGDVKVFEPPDPPLFSTLLQLRLQVVESLKEVCVQREDYAEAQGWKMLHSKLQALVDVAANPRNLQSTIQTTISAIDSLKIASKANGNLTEAAAWETHLVELVERWAPEVDAAVALGLSSLDLDQQD